jgi:hypothetical protein
MSIKESAKEIKPPLESPILEGDFDIVPHGESSISWKKHAISIGLLVLVASASFGLGRLAYLENNRAPVVIRSADGSNLPQDTLVDTPSSVTPGEPAQKQSVSNGLVKGASVSATVQSTDTINTQSAVVASKAGTKYHYPWCPGAKQISPANKITFASIAEARKAGYTPAANCKGLK